MESKIETHSQTNYTESVIRNMSLDGNVTVENSNATCNYTIEFPYHFFWPGYFVISVVTLMILTSWCLILYICLKSIVGTGRDRVMVLSTRRTSSGTGSEELADTSVRQGLIAASGTVDSSSISSTSAVENAEPETSTQESEAAHLLPKQQRTVRKRLPSGTASKTSSDQ